MSNARSIRLGLSTALPAIVILMLATPMVQAQVILWDNEIGPPWGPHAGRAVSPPGWPDIRVVDDVIVGESGWVVSEFVPTLIEPTTWHPSGTATVYVYEDADGRPVNRGLYLDQLVQVDRIFAGIGPLSFPAYYHATQVGVALPPGRWWLGLRDGNAKGESSGAWTTTPEGKDRGPYGYMSLDRGETWMYEGPRWHHAFEVRGFVIGEQAPGYVREIEPIAYSGDPVGGVEEIRDGDDAYYELTADLFSRVSRAHLASVIFKTRLPAFPLDGLGLRVESTNTHTTVRQELAMFDHDADAWVVVVDRPLRSDGDMIVTIESLDDPDRFVGDADGQVQLRLDAYSPGTTLTRHTVKIDQVNFLVTYAPM